MEIKIEVNCPECGEADTNFVEVDELRTYVTCICEACENAYVVRIDLTPVFVPFTLVRKP